MDLTTGIIALALGLVVGFVIAKLLEKGKAARTIESAKKEAATILKSAASEGESLKKDTIYQAMEKFLELKAELEKVIKNSDS